MKTTSPEALLLKQKIEAYVFNDVEKRYIKSFKTRLTELGMVQDIDYTFKFERFNKNDRPIWDVEVKYDGKSKVEREMRIHAIMGMVYHFSNRKWIIGNTYTYILKSIQSIVFNNGEVETH